MAENQDGTEKSEEPTAKRLQKARTDGQIARSKELNTFALTLAGAIGLFIMGPQFGEVIQGLFNHNFAPTREDIMDPMATIRHITDAIGASLAHFLLVREHAPVVDLGCLSKKELARRLLDEVERLINSLKPEGPSCR